MLEHRHVFGLWKIRREEGLWPSCLCASSSLPSSLLLPSPQVLCTPRVSLGPWIHWREAIAIQSGGQVYIAAVFPCRALRVQ